MIKSRIVKVKPKEEIEETFQDVDEWGGKIECAIPPYKERIEMRDDMLDVIGGQEIEIFPYRGHGSYTARHWYDGTGTKEGGVWAMYLLKEWYDEIKVEKVN